ncbi:uncharacterized protein DS421_13g394800 [Arachis hypogaea]|nr:uncharacterized protein DS421_13g394800 [Arachis hypogaea]
MEQQLLDYEHEMYRLDQVEHIVGRLDRVAPRILHTKRNLMTRPTEQIRPYMRRAGFEYVAYMVEFEHDWSLTSALIERWRPESHTFHLPCGEMTITLQDVAYQLGFRIDGDPVSGCIEDRQSQTKWTIKLTWFHNTVCGELEQDATEERLMRYTRGYIMQLIGGILFPDASDSQVHIRWLPLLEDLDACGRLSWGSAVLAWLYRQMCWATEHGQRNLRGCVSLMLSLGLPPWVQYRPDNATGEAQVEWTPYADPQLFGLVPPAIAEADASAAVVCPLLYFAIVEWHQMDRVVRQFGGLQHIPTRPLNIDDMHRLDERFGRGEWFPHLLGGCHKAWANHRLPIYHHIDM